MQALQLLPELIFDKDMDVPIEASHSKSNISFWWASAKLKDIELRKT